MGAQPDRPLRPRPPREGGPRAVAEADRITLLRRLSLDLIGLPPTPEEVDAFLADRSPDAYEKQVERLLASPHYGERWAAHWLDAARYADSDGFEKDKPRSVWFYRDWVIDALNRDLPYDQFVIEQIAGDLLPGRDAGPDRRHRLPAQLDDQRGGRHRPRAVPHGGDVRPHGRHRQGRPRPDDPVRPVPQPQVRPAHAGGVLPPVRLPQQRRTRRTSPSTRPTSRCEIAPSVFRRIREIEDELQHRHPDWRERHGSVGGRGRRPSQPEWIVVRARGRRRSPPAARSTCRWRTARSWRRATRRPSTRVKMTRARPDAPKHHAPSAWSCSTTRTCRSAARAARSRGPAR